eukprot:TRINITY_DN12671_c0_g1_i2.p1 TRINITY_DN12671_c0_g1~~TRINITY_DN12671_c0_g1_i2.p1  ORF type:complete len:205 (+),score=46.36 TRINITY_DN12671_c0_g1_i2:465-1079(+)
MTVNGRGKIVAGGGVEHTGSEGAKIYVIDADSGSLESTSPVISNGWNDLWHIAVDETQDLVYASLNKEIWQYNITNNHLVKVPEGDGSTGGVAVTKFGQLVFAKGSSLVVKFGNDVTTHTLSEELTGPISCSSVYDDILWLSYASSFSLFDLTYGEQGKHQTMFTPWKVQHYWVDEIEYLLVGEHTAVHLYQVTDYSLSLKTLF